MRSWLSRVGKRLGKTDSRFTIPAAMALYVDDGLRTQLAITAELVAETAFKRVPAGQLSPCQLALRRQDVTRELLGEIGWEAETPPREPTIDLHRHGAALLQASESALETERDLLKNSPGDNTPLKARGAHELRDFIAQLRPQVEAIAEASPRRQAA